MKPLIPILVLICTLTACGVKPRPTPDLAGMVSATLTAMPTPTPAPSATPTPTVESTPTSAPTYSPGAKALPADLLRNGTYTSLDWGEYKLTDGLFYRTPPLPQESPDAYTTRMLDTILYGDVNLDGMEDAVVILATQSGGTGHFIEMAVVLDQDGKPVNAATQFLGDRVVVESGSIQDGLVTLNMRVQGPNDGLCCPSQQVTWTFRLENGQLVQVS